jgi:hypothetical protein
MSLQEPTTEGRNAVNAFVQKHRSHVIGVLSGFDRLVFRGTVRPICYVEGMKAFLAGNGILLKDFGDYAEATSNRVKQASLAVAERAERPVEYLASPKVRKEERAREIAQRDAIENGLICVFKTVEPLMGFAIRGNRETHKLELRMEQRKCLYLYHYYQHPVFGFMHIRLQTWFPFQVQVWINGREWLACTLDRNRIAYQRRDNCFPWIATVERAQQLMNAQLAIQWPFALDLLRAQAHPIHDQMFAPWTFDYYWSVYQSEWATDVMFRDHRTLAELYQRLVHYGITRFQCQDVLRFLGKKVLTSSGIHGGFTGEVTSDLKHRPEGIRLKHYVSGNSVKIYDKHGSVLRAETTINDPSGFKVYRTAEGDEHGTPTWRPMRKGVADMVRRTEVSQAVNDRYLDALASCEDATPLGELTADACRPVTWNGRRVRALHPWSPHDLDLLRAVGRAEFMVNGFRNADLCRVLHGPPSQNSAVRRRRSATMTRNIRLLRAHGLVHKRPKSHRYMVTPKGHRILSALLAAHQANAETLVKLAA